MYIYINVNVYMYIIYIDLHIDLYLGGFFVVVFCYAEILLSLCILLSFNLFKPLSVYITLNNSQRYAFNFGDIFRHHKTLDLGKAGVTPFCNFILGREKLKLYFEDGPKGVSANLIMRGI